MPRLQQTRAAEHLVDSQYLWDPESLDAYMEWYTVNGKPSVYQKTVILQGLSQPLPGPSQDISTMGVPPSHEVVPRQVRRFLKFF